jgi:hypothetical protein
MLNFKIKIKQKHSFTLGPPITASIVIRDKESFGKIYKVTDSSDNKKFRSSLGIIIIKDESNSEYFRILSSDIPTHIGKLWGEFSEHYQIREIIGATEDNIKEFVDIFYKMEIPLK